MDHTSYVDALLAIATLVSLAQHKAPKPERAPIRAMANPEWQTFEEACASYRAKWPVAK